MALIRCGAAISDDFLPDKGYVNLGCTSIHTTNPGQAEQPTHGTYTLGTAVNLRCDAPGGFAIINVKGASSLTFGTSVSYDYNNLLGFSNGELVVIATNNDTTTAKTVDVSSYDYVMFNYASGSSGYSSAVPSFTVS